uniref:Uncharacterized protein n=1 Tax=Rhizophora mucronata TaxID=61149 RepID=A0A2P2MMD1_RHIMU
MNIKSIINYARILTSGPRLKTPSKRVSAIPMKIGRMRYFKHFVVRKIFIQASIQNILPEKSKDKRYL